MVTIRLATAQDNEAISRVHMAAIRESCSSHYDERQIEAWASKRTPEFYQRVLATQELFVAERHGEVVGFGQIDLESGMAVALYIAPEAAGGGVGSAMLDHLEALVRQQGWRHVHLTASLNAVPFFEKRGYHRVRPFRHQVATDVYLDWVDMKKSFQPS